LAQIGAVITTLYLVVDTPLIDSSDIMYHLAFNKWLALSIIWAVLAINLALFYSVCINVIAKRSKVTVNKVRKKWIVVALSTSLAITSLSAFAFGAKVTHVYSGMYRQHIVEVKSLICDSDSPVKAARVFNWNNRTLKLAIAKGGFQHLAAITSANKFLTDKAINLAEGYLNESIKLDCDKLNAELAEK
jgi:hypothetical protein